MFRNKIFGSEGGDKILKECLTLYYFVKTVFSKKNYTKNLDGKWGNERELL